MGLNKTNIEWTDLSWNPVTGCKNGCPYCYARNISNRFHGHFNPQLHEDRLTDPFGMRTPDPIHNLNSRKEWVTQAFPDNWLIFTCSMGELFGEWVPDEWRDKVFKTIWECPAHIFQILTKNPENIEPYVTRRGGTERWVNYPDNLWLGTSVDYAKNIKRIEHLTDSRIYADVKFASFEPLKECMDGVDLSGLDWIIIGGQTGQKEFIPPESWVVSILDAAGANGIPVFLKDNLFFDKQIREFPKI